jgi:hypothetical protein
MRKRDTSPVGGRSLPEAGRFSRGFPNLRLTESGVDSTLSSWQLSATMFRSSRNSGGTGMLKPRNGE